VLSAHILSVCVPGCIELYIFIVTVPPAGTDPNGSIVDVDVVEVVDVVVVEVVLEVDVVLLVDVVLVEVVVVGGCTM
jgi:hypothetical protein